MAVITALAFLRPGSFSIGGNYARVESHNPLDTIKGTKFDQYYRGYFLDSRSPEEDRAIMARIEADIADEPARKTRIEIAILLDLFLVTLIVVALLVRLIVRKRSTLREAALDGAAATLKAYRKARTATGRVASEIDRRSNHID